MIQIELDEKTVLGLVAGTLESRIDFLSNQDVIANLDISTIKKIYQYKIDEADGCFNLEIITLLQALAYNRGKPKDREEIVIFVLDKLFEFISTGEEMD